MKFLYARVSSNDGSQKIDRQITEIEKYDEVKYCKFKLLIFVFVISGTKCFSIKSF